MFFFLVLLTTPISFIASFGNLGKVINEEKEEKIRGVLKYMWATGASTGKNLRAVQPLSPKSVLEQIKERQPPSP